MIEMLVVLSMLGLAAGLIVPRIGAGSDLNAARMATSEIATILTRMQLDALKRGRVRTARIAQGALLDVQTGDRRRFASATLSAEQDIRFKAAAGAQGGPFLVCRGAHCFRLSVDLFTGAVLTERVRDD